MTGLGRVVGPGLAFLVLGFAAIIFGWYGTSKSPTVWEEMPYLVSGGIGGLALVIIGCFVLRWQVLSAISSEPPAA